MILPAFSGRLASLTREVGGGRRISLRLQLRAPSPPAGSLGPWAADPESQTPSASHKRGHSYLDGGACRCPRRDANEEALLHRQPLGHGDGIVARDLDGLGQKLHVEVAGDEAGADALDLVGARLTPRDDGGLGRLHRDDLDVGVLAPQKTSDSCDGPPGPDARDEDVDLAVRRRPDLRPGGLEMDLWRTRTYGGERAHFL